MKDFRSKIIWITGASSGIGREMAIQSNAIGAIVILSSRNEGELKVTQNLLPNPENSMVLLLDMMEQKEFPNKVNKILERYGKIHLLFNNAGLSQRSAIKSTSEEVDRRLMEINYFGTILLTKAVLPHMRQQGYGHIAVTSSLAGKFGFYQRSAYAASKHALHGFFETLALEEEENNIAVTLVCPGGVKTNISVNAVAGDGKKYGKASELQEEGLEVTEAVKQIIDAVKSDKQEATIGKPLEKISLKVKALYPSLFWKLIKKRKPADRS